MSIVNRRIDTVVSGAFAQLLKRHHFRKDGRTFRRWDGLQCLIVNVQASHGNSGEYGRFYVNLAVYAPALQRPEGSSEKPREFQGQRRTRLEQGPAPSDGWWDIGPETLTVALSAELADVMERTGLPWLSAQARALRAQPSGDQEPLDMTHN